MLGDETNETEWSKNIARLTEFAHETVVGFDAQYNETVWFPMARNVMSHYMEVLLPRNAFLCLAFS